MEFKKYDAVIIGSGFGGTMTAKKLSDAGWTVAIIERGERVKRGPENWADNGSIDLTPNYDKSLPYEVIKGGNKKQMGVYSAVGGPSIFYGGVSFRFREQDFHPSSELVRDSEAEWPIDYNDLEQYYDEAEQLLQISGESGVDPTEPKRNQPFPQSVPPYAEVSQKVKSAAESLGLHPFHLPLAINYKRNTSAGAENRTSCQFCTTCDTFACAVGAKNDLDTMLLSKMTQGSVDLYTGTIAHRIEVAEGQVRKVHCIRKESGEEILFEGRVCILSAGALASPHLVLNSGLEALNPAGHIVGRYLMRHVNAIVFGVFAGIADKEGRFHKELAILDYYFGHPEIDFPGGKIGSLQQVPTPPSGLVENEAPKPLGKLAGKLVKLLTGLLAIAEDQPQFQNYITVDKSKIGAHKMATPIVSHEYTERDMAAIKILIAEAKKIMKKAGAVFNYTHYIRTFSHSAGTMRMGISPKTSPLDKNCNFRGVENLYVVDACFMPTSAALNPSLTISANALRVGQHLIDTYKIKEV
ncbi:MAG: choline dehydrogenase-like flavoprotein [Saprospiraceae bacterium]|jgi:choline dehydrogenase-like flavoprotein